MVMRTRLGATLPFAPAGRGAVLEVEEAIVLPAGIATREATQAAERRRGTPIQIAARETARFWLRGAPFIGIQVIP
jgi:hypothetical protein